MDKRKFLKTVCTIESVILQITGRRREPVPTVTVLTYHGVTGDTRSDNLPRLSEFNIAENVFERQIRYLVRHCNVVSVKDVFEGRKLSRRKRNIVITFDDGYRNNYLTAYPILKKYNLPALVSIATGFVQERVPLWNDVLEWTIRNTRLRSCEITLDNTGRRVSLATIAERVDFYKWTMHYAVGIDQSLREKFISRIASALDVKIDNTKILSDNDFAPLTDTDIKRLCRDSNIEIASHSVGHFNLTKLNSDLLKKEVVASKKIVESLTSRPCIVFCIPGGDYNRECLDMIKDAGYKIVMTSEFRPYIHKPGNTFTRMGRPCITTLHDDIHIFQDLVNGYLLKNYHKIRALVGFYRKTQETAGV